MCYAIPGRIVEMAGREVQVEYYGERRKCFNEIGRLAVGDWVYAQGGYVIDIVSEAEAKSVLDIWKDLFFELKEIDKGLTLKRAKPEGVDERVLGILDKASQERPLTDDECALLLGLEQPAARELLYGTANLLRQKHLDNACCVHGIVEFSNTCGRDCAYCGISVHNRDLPRFRMTEEEIVESALAAIEGPGFKALVLQSAEDPGFPVEKIARVVEEIRRRAAALIFVSCGEVGIPGLQRLWDAGARGLLMRFETSNPVLYRQLHPEKELEDRLAHLRAAYDMGYLVVTGGLVGLPGQTPADIVADIKLAKELHAEMFSFGPFLPHPATPLADHPAPDAALVMNTLALARIIDPSNAKILVTTGFETLAPDAVERGLMAGANSVMLNVTPQKYKEAYSIYPNRAHVHEDLQKQIDTTIALLQRLGRAPTDLGVS